MSNIFKEDAKKIKNSVVCDIEKSVKQYEATGGKENQFEAHFAGIDTVIYAVGAQSPDPEHVRLMENAAGCSLVETAVKCGAKKFILVSSAMITRETDMIGFALNTFVPNCLGHKAGVENKLRQSGLEYVIVRPTILDTNKAMTIQETPKNE